MPLDVPWTMFDERIISTEHWPLHFLHMNVCGFYFKGMLKQTLTYSL